MSKYWTKDETEFLEMNYKDMSFESIALSLNRTTEAVSGKAKRMRLIKNNHWTKEEDEFLLENYGKKSISYLKNILNRTESAIKCRIALLEGTSCPEVISNNLSLKDVSVIMGVNQSTVGQWARKNEIPHVKFSTNRVLIREYSFWKWLKSNLHKVNFKKVGDDVEMIVPKWYKDEVKLNKRNFSKKVKGKCNQWTQYEETRAWDMFIKGYTNNDIALELDRTFFSVKGKMTNMKRKKLNK